MFEADEGEGDGGKKPAWCGSFLMKHGSLLAILFLASNSRLSTKINK
ncbi:hypothetical protein J6W20_02760 [bacterium]|nr:hypothetical protein [bacterium]